MVDRLVIILSALNQSGEPVSIASLAELAGVSSRTIYNDISRINDKLEEAGYAGVSIKRGEAVLSQQIGVDVARVVVGGESIYSNRTLRRKRIAELSLMLPDCFSVADIARHFDLSRNTILRDFEALVPTYGFYRLRLEGEHFRGYRIDGSEPDARRMLVQLIQDDPTFIDQETTPAERAFLERVRSVITTYTKELGVRLSDSSFEFLEAAFFAVRKRLDIGKGLNDGETSFDELPTKELDLVTANASDLSRLFCHQLDRCELVYIAEYLASASGIDQKDSLSENWIRFGFLVEQLIEDVGDRYPAAAFLDDEQLFSGLMNHLRPAYHRALMGIHIDNPLYDLAVGEYADLDRVVQDALEPVQHELGVEFIEQERAYFTLFFAASIERSRRLLHRPRVALVCGTGRATSEIIRARLASRFDVEIAGTFGSREIGSWLAQHEVDIVLTTVPIGLPDQNVLVVDSSFTQGDEERFGQALARLARNERRALRHSEASEPSEPSCVSDDVDVEAFTEGRQRAALSLNEVLPPQAVSLGFSACDKVDAVREAGRLLVENGFADLSYVDAMVENASSNGVYIVVAPGVAFPHAASERGARRVGFSVVTLKQPVAFGNSINDPVRLCIGLCMIDHQSHLKPLAELVSVLNDPSAVARIVEAQTVRDVMDVLLEPHKPASGSGRQV